MFIGDGAKLVRDAFNLAKEKAPAIIFIDELDAIGTKRFDSEKSGDREVQRTMLELLNQLDGFSSDDRIKVGPSAVGKYWEPRLIVVQVIAATNRIDILDPALLRSGRLDRKIEFPVPNEEARARIMQIHSRKMTVSPDVNFDELSRSCDEFNGAQCKAVCVEAGMIALRRGASEITHEDFMEGKGFLVFPRPFIPLTEDNVQVFRKYRQRRRHHCSIMLKLSNISSSLFQMVACIILLSWRCNALAQRPHPFSGGAFLQSLQRSCWHHVPQPKKLNKHHRVF